MQKSCFERHWKFLSSYDYYRISITMCDVSKGGGGWGGGGGSPEKRTYDVSRGQNRYVRLPLVLIIISEMLI